MPSLCTVTYFRGEGNDTTIKLIGPPKDEDKDTFFSLIDLNLQPEDYLKISYDLGSPQVFIVDVLELKKDQPLLHA